MSTLTIRMPDATHERLRDLARSRGVSINKLIEEMATATLSAHDAEVRFRLMACTWQPRACPRYTGSVGCSRSPQGHE